MGVGSRSAHGRDGGGGGERGSSKKKLGICSSDMQVFEESQWEVRKTTSVLSTHAVAISGETRGHEGADTHPEVRLSDTIITGRKRSVCSGDARSCVA